MKKPCVDGFPSTGELKKWQLILIWIAIAIVLTIAGFQWYRNARELSDPESKLSRQVVAAQAKQEQERKEIAGKYYADPRPVLMGAYQGTEVKLIEIGGHEYIVATAYAGNHSGGSSVSVTHHVGCKACQKKEVNDDTR